jgi:hypothetical protein
MKLIMPAVCNLLAISLTVPSVLAVSSSHSPDMLDVGEPSSPFRDLSANIFSCSSQVFAWELIDTNTDIKVMDLVNGTIVYDDQPSFSIRAVTSGSETRSVRLTLNGGYTNTENAAPYALCTNKGSVYRRCDGLTHGKHVVTGSACCDRGGLGTCQQPPTALDFEIRLPTPTNAPSYAPLQTRSPTVTPTKAPTTAPTTTPTKATVPTKDPTNGPTKAPAEAPTMAPTEAPSKNHSNSPTKAPTTGQVLTKAPTQAPTKVPASNYSIHLGFSGNMTTHYYWRLDEGKHDPLVAPK